MRIFRSLIAIAALTCSVMLATAAPAAPPGPEIANAFATAGEVIAPAEAAVAVVVAPIAEPSAASACSTSGPLALDPAFAFTVGAHRVHVDPGRAFA